ncbi:MAG TPA: OmpA family protein [Polyangiales bacterium]|jgi:chemotaxis protein MotB|nr:OmpA family protein [Polyangiales bacterium]
MNRSKTLVLAVILGVLAGACGYSDEEMQAERDRITNKLQGERAADKAAADKKIQELALQNAALTEQLRKLGINVEDQKRSLEESNKALEELKAKERQAQQRLATFKGMLDRFQKMIESGKLKVKIVRGRMVVELSENILFDSGRADLKKEGQDALTEVATVLAAIQDRDFQIAGHTDNIPIKSAKFPSNWHLSTARALTVGTYLADHGVPPVRLSAAGYADTQPAAPNDTPEGRQQNRRIEIVLMPNLDELPDLSQLKDMK